MKESISAYPLSWPVGYSRSKIPKLSRFEESTLAKVRDGLLDELRMLKAKDVILSTNIPLRLDGLPYSNRRPPEDKGVAVYFTLDNEQHVFACDKWRRIEDNIHAIELAVHAIRGLDRWGVSDMLKRAFSGFKALPENASENFVSWWIILEVDRDSTIEQIKKSYRGLAKIYHPDGSHPDVEKFRIIKKAYEQALSQQN